MNTWKTGILVLPLMIAILSACGGTKANVYTEKGLVTGKPGMNMYSLKDPGETAPIKRPYQTAPPLVPHTVSGFTINRSTNECLDCHLEGEEIGDGHGRTPRVPQSHFTNEHTGEERAGQVVGIRYYCVQCHVPQSEEEPPYSGKEH